MSGPTSSAGSEPDYEKKGVQTPPEAQVLEVSTPALKHSKYSLRALGHWLGDRDVHVWIMSLGEWFDGGAGVQRSQLRKL